MHKLDDSTRLSENVVDERYTRGKRLKLRVIYAFLAVVHLFICRYIHQYFLAETPSFAYMGLHWYDNSVDVVTLFIIMAIIPAISIMPINSTRSDCFLLNVLYGMIYIPTVGLMPNISTTSLQATLPFALVFLMGILILVKFSNGRWFIICDVGMSQKIYNKFLFVSSGAVILVYALFTQARITSFDLTNLYSARAEFFDAATNLPGPVIYIFGNAAFALAPIMVAHGILTKQPLLYFTGVFIGITTFLVTSLRSMLFVVILVFIFSFLTRWKVAPGISVMMTFIILAALAIGIDAYNLAPVPDIVFSLHYRLFGNSATISSGYLEFFENFPFFYYSQSSLLGSIFASPSIQPYQLLVGESISTVTGNHANGNLMADSYANGGFVSIMLTFIMLTILLRLYSNMSEDKDTRVRALALVAPAFYLSNAGLQSVLFSGGLVLTFILMAAYPLPCPLDHRRLNSIS